jgi:threonyl-tRNA synthetase
VDERSEKIGYKIREAQVQQIAYMLVVGDKEVEAHNVAVRHRRLGDLGTMDVLELARQLSRLAAERAVTDEVTAAGGVS